MDRTVVAVCDGLDDAQAVRDDLLAAGMVEDNIEIHCEAGGDVPNAAPFDTPAGSDGWSGQRAAFLARLFGLDHDIDDALHLKHAMQHGRCVVAVNVKDDDEVERALAVLARHGPFDEVKVYVDRQAEASGAGDHSAPEQAPKPRKPS